MPYSKMIDTYLLVMYVATCQNKNMLCKFKYVHYNITTNQLQSKIIMEYM